MNKQTNTTRPTADAIIGAVRDLEGPIFDLATMADILAEMLEDNLVEYDRAAGKTRGVPREGDVMTVILTKSQVDRLAFAWNDVLYRAAQLKRAYSAALDLREEA